LTLIVYHTKDTTLQPVRQWYFDSRTSDHIIGDREVFIDFTSIVLFPITLSDGSKVYVTGKGIVILNVNGTGNIIFIDVLYSRSLEIFAYYQYHSLPKRELNSLSSGRK